MVKLKNSWVVVFPLIFAIFLYLIIKIDNYLNLPKLPFKFDFIGLFLIVIGLILLISCYILFDILGEGTPVPKQITPKLVTKRLVVIGPYKYTRNPMMLGILFILIGLSFYFKSYLMLSFTFVFAFIAHFFIVNIEEKDMEQRFGKDYLEYKKRVPRWLFKRD